MRYVLHYAPGAASFAVHWMLVELQLGFHAERLDLRAGDQKSSAFLQLNPLGRVPVLVIDGTPYAEAAALLMMLGETHPDAGLAPRVGDPERSRWLEMMVYLANAASPAMRDWFYAEADGGENDAPGIKRLARQRIEGVWGRLDQVLRDRRPYLLGGKLTTADFLATMLMMWSRNMPRPSMEWDHVNAYVRRVSVVPSFRETCRREGLVDWMRYARGTNRRRP